MTTDQIEVYQESFRNHLERLGYSQTSVLMLPACLKDFLLFLSSSSSIEQITSTEVLSWYEHLQSRPNKRRDGALSENYINHHIYSLKLFFAWQQESGKLSVNPMSGLKFKRPATKAREVLSVEEIKRLYSVAETLHERAVLGLFYGCGLRRSEAVRLDLKDLHLRANLLYVRKGKNSKRRAVPLSERVRNDLSIYIHQQRPLMVAKGTESDAVILNSKGRRMSGNYLNKLLKVLVKKAGIKKQISLHCLRHSIATHLLEAGLSVEYVRDFLGHSHLESTQIYTRISQKQING